MYAQPTQAEAQPSDGVLGSQPPNAPGLVEAERSASEHAAEPNPPTPRVRTRPEQLKCGPWLLEVAGPKKVTTRVLRRGEHLIIGSGAEADVRVDDPALGACQARLSVLDQGLVVQDLNESDAIRVGGVHLSAATIVEGPCRLELGATQIRLSFGRGAAAEPCAQDIPGLVGCSPAMHRLGREIRRFATLRAPVLVQGETGSGKDVVARALHELSGRSGPFIALNVGGMNENVADTELFGHRKGAFTGAAHSRPGVFEAANGGTLFLDEIADLHPSIQVKLLRVIEDQQVRPLGTHETTSVDTRVICASWADLEERVAAGRFRADLFHRVSTIRLELPPLRCRKDDLRELSEHLLRRYAIEFGQKELAPAALERLAVYDWPGNVRELGSVLYRAAAEVGGRAFIDQREIEGALPRPPRKRVSGLDASELQRLLDANGGNVSAAARAARVPRSTFRTLLKRETASCRTGSDPDDSANVVQGASSRAAAGGDVLAA